MFAGNSSFGKAPFCTLCLVCALFFLYALTCCAGCAESNSRKDNVDTLSQGDGAAATIEWFYFDDSGALLHAENPAHIPAVKFKPWTEAVAVLDAGIAGGVPVLLVNKKGLVSPAFFQAAADGAPEAVYQDMATDGLFPSADKLAAGTAISLVSENGGTYIRFYRNSVFAGNGDAQPVALFSCGNPPFFPLKEASYAADFGVNRNAQFVSLAYSGAFSEPWVTAFKSALPDGGGFLFEYAAFPSLPVPDVSGSAGAAPREISAGEFQSAVEKSADEPLPDAFAGFVALVPSAYGYSLTISGRGFPVSKTVASGKNASVLSGCGFLTDDTAAALFSDGTLYLSRLEKNARIRTVRLPALNRGYIYTSFVVSGDTVLAGWEERRFFETGRSGLLFVVLNQSVSG